MVYPTLPLTGLAAGRDYLRDADHLFLPAESSQVQAQPVVGHFALSSCFMFCETKLIPQQTPLY